MAKKKSKKSLYEVLSQKTTSRLDIPEWIRPGQTADEDGEEKQPAASEIHGPEPEEESSEEEVAILEITAPSPPEPAVDSPTKTVEKEAVTGDHDSVETAPEPAEDQPADTTAHLFDEITLRDEPETDIPAAGEPESPYDAPDTAAPAEEEYADEEIEEEEEEEEEERDTETAAPAPDAEAPETEAPGNEDNGIAEDDTADTTVRAIPLTIERKKLDTGLPAKYQQKKNIAGFISALLPTFRRRGERIEIAIDFLGAMVALGLLLTIPVFAFLIGWWVAPGGEDTADTVETAAAKPPLPAGGHKPAPPQPAKNGDDAEPVETGLVAKDSRRDADRYYPIIQILQGDSEQDKNEAQRIIAFLRSRGLYADAKYKNKGRMVVWSLRGFASRESAATEKFAEKIEKLGSEYFAKYQTYKFNGPYFRKGKI